MKNSKMKKYLISSSLFLGVAGIFISSTMSYSLNNKEDVNTYSDLLKDKLIKRSEFQSVNYSLDQNSKISPKEDKTYRIKLLLKYELENSENIYQDVSLFSEKNKLFLDNIVANLKNVKSYSFSRLSPFVWINFHDEEFKKENLEIIANYDFVFKVFSYEKNNETSANYYSYRRVDRQSLDKFSSDKFLDQLKQINFTKQREKEDLTINSSNYKDSIGKIGILEVIEKKNPFGNGLVNPFLEYFDNKSVILHESKPGWDFHGSLVAAIAGGKTGVDRFAKLYSAGHQTDEEWQQRLEWMVIENGIRVINHSYGSNHDLNQVEYNEQSYFIDYLARKYGVVNVFASGNGHDEPDKKNEWIDGTQLSFNSVVVGSSSKGNDSYVPSVFSNRLKFEKYLNLPKPLVVAPGEKYNFLSISGIEGTSFAAPIVSGAISVLLREKPHLNNDDNRVPSIKAILAASGNDDNFDLKENKQINPNGLENAIGTGVIDFEKMKEAANNLVNLSIKKSNNQSEIVYESPIIKLSKKEKIQIASSWLFNAGILKNEESVPKYHWQVNWLGFMGGPLIGGIASGIYNGVYWSQIEKWKEEWSKTHLDSFLLKKDETFSRQESKFFSDYDLYLEKKDSSGKWNPVKYINVVASNVEFIRYISDSGGEYRIVIKKYKDSIFDNSIDDVLAVTYVKK
ncbi:S8 family serine peptidase [Candidatus Mycoplasma pogonae]